ncbi:MAG TPA: (d)CMP kinase [Vicinamibacteria bacterium]|nr:(d)CMP kinase [Vicinamibacteria bacterium]
MTARTRGLVVAIDGPSGAGKSTVGRALAARLGYTYVDTGAMYRALTLKAIRAGLSPDTEGPLVALARGTLIDLEDEGRRVRLDGADVTAEIRSREVTGASSRVSAHPGVRRDMVDRQRRLGAEGGVVLDGRDIGTAVFPDAEAKFYLDADPRKRAGRRQAELHAAGSDVGLEELEREIRARDKADSTRADSPLTRAADATLLDTTELTADEVVERMASVIAARQGSRG